MTKPEFDKLYNEKIARGLDFPLDGLYESLSSASPTDLLGHALAHQLAQDCLNTAGGNNIHITRWQMSVDAGATPSIDIRLVIL